MDLIAPLNIFVECRFGEKSVSSVCVCSVTGGELFEDIVAREYYSESDARYGRIRLVLPVKWARRCLRHD